MLDALAVFTAHSETVVVNGEHQAYLIMKSLLVYKRVRNIPTGEKQPQKLHFLSLLESSDFATQWREEVVLRLTRASNFK